MCSLLMFSYSFKFAVVIRTFTMALKEPTFTKLLACDTEVGISITKLFQRIDLKKVEINTVQHFMPTSS